MPMPDQFTTFHRYTTEDMSYTHRAIDHAYNISTHTKEVFYGKDFDSDHCRCRGIGYRNSGRLSDPQKDRRGKDRFCRSGGEANFGGGRKGRRCQKERGFA